MDDGHRTDDGPWLYYKLTNEPKGSGELINKIKSNQITVMVLKVKYKGILFYEILMDCVPRKRMQTTTSSYLKWFPRYCDLNFYMLSH